MCFIFFRRCRQQGRRHNAAAAVLCKIVSLCQGTSASNASFNSSLLLFFLLRFAHSDVSLRLPGGSLLVPRLRIACTLSEYPYFADLHLPPYTHGHITKEKRGSYTHTYIHASIYFYINIRILAPALSAVAELWSWCTFRCPPLFCLFFSYLSFLVIYRSFFFVCVSSFLPLSLFFLTSCLSFVQLEVIGGKNKKKKRGTVRQAAVEWRH